MKFFCWTEIKTTPWTNSVYKFPGVYAIYDPLGTLVYIGSSMNLRRRVARYRCNKNPDWKLKVRYTKVVGEWAFREIRLIRRLSPELNFQKFTRVSL